MRATHAPQTDDELAEEFNEVKAMMEEADDDVDRQPLSSDERATSTD